MKGCFEKSQKPVVVFHIIMQRIPLMLFAREFESIHSALSQSAMIIKFDAITAFGLI